MKRTLRRLALLSVAMVLGFASCEKENSGYEYVDLGLPSGTKWATCNVGATAPHEYGNYYAWGEVSTKSDYAIENYILDDVSMSDITGDATYDAARANLGGLWRMPTKIEMEELVNSCTWTSVEQNGVYGMQGIGPNGNCIFFPAAGDYDGISADSIGAYGHYWTSTPDENSNIYSCSFLFYSSEDYIILWDYRTRGRSIRPVSD